jgi:hypothetical protein
VPAIAINNPIPDDEKEEDNSNLDFVKIGQSRQ